MEKKGTMKTMDFKEMIEKISFLEEKQQKRADILRKKQEEQKKEEIEHINFDEIDFEDLLVPMVSSVNYDLGMKNFTPANLVLRDLLNVKQLKSIPIEEKQQVLLMILTKLKNTNFESGSYAYRSIFDETFTPYKNSLRMLTEGKQVKHVLSKKAEVQIMKLYLSIFEQQMSYYFDFISFDEYAKNYIPLALELSFIPGSRVSKIKKHHIFDFFVNSIFPKLTDQSFVVSLLKDYYQKEQLTFATPKNLGDIRFVKKYSFLLSHEQQKEIVEQFIPICMDKIHYYTSTLQEESDDNPGSFLKPLYLFKKDLEFFHDLQKGMTEDELK